MSYLYRTTSCELLVPQLSAWGEFVQNYSF